MFVFALSFFGWNWHISPACFLTLLMWTTFLIFVYPISHLCTFRTQADRTTVCNMNLQYGICFLLGMTTVIFGTVCTSLGDARSVGSHRLACGFGGSSGGFVTSMFGTLWAFATVILWLTILRRKLKQDNWTQEINMKSGSNFVEFRRISWRFQFMMHLWTFSAALQSIWIDWQQQQRGLLMLSPSESSECKAKTATRHCLVETAPIIIQRCCSIAMHHFQSLHRDVLLVHSQRARWNRNVSLFCTSCYFRWELTNWFSIGRISPAESHKIFATPSANAQRTQSEKWRKNNENFKH